jgi:hypothetical protein
VGLACLAGLIALLVVVGWFLEVEVLVSPGGHSTSTKFVTAVMSLTLGAAVVTLAGRVRDALAAATDAAAITDDASAVEAMGHAPMLVEGHPRNLKVTLPRDIAIAEMYLAAP